MKTTHSSLLAAIALFGLPVSGLAAVVGFDSFSYPDGPISGQNGGIGWDYGSPGSPSAWSGSVNVSGGSLLTGGFNGAVRDYGSAGGGSAFQGSGIVYYRFELTLGSALPNYFGLSSMDFGSERIKFGRWWEGGTFGVEFDNGSGWTQYGSSISITPGGTYTLIGVLDFDNDRLALYVNPTGSSFYDPTSGANNADAGGVYTMGNWSTGMRFESGGGGDDVAWHEVTIGTSPADVGLLAIPEPSTLALFGIGMLSLAGWRRVRRG
ncbi:MAG: PEP-CTERM sorting domain-containing protein [Terrimicrobiaceae bacterium]|nr:PEP-CTERM sorting domain-containing protein [Terrimicrobiaceae bacterium]